MRLHCIQHLTKHAEPPAAWPHPSYFSRLGLLYLILMLIWEPPAPFHQDTCPDCLIVFRCRSFPLQKGKNGVGPEAFRVLCQFLDTQKRGRCEWGGGVGEESREQTPKSGSDPGNARLQTMCSLYFCSPLCGTYHCCHSHRGGACERRNGFISPTLFYLTSIQRAV